MPSFVCTCIEMHIWLCVCEYAAVEDHMYACTCMEIYVNGNRNL